MTNGAALAIDLGGTRIKAGIVVEHDVVLQRIVPTGDEHGFDHVLHTLYDVSEALLHEHPATAIGVCLPGVVDVARGALVDVRKNLAGLIDFPLVDAFQRRFGLPVAVENDARLYGLGEMVAGAAQGVGNMVCLTLGTGVGCCVALDGYILRGPRGTGGVLGGHMTLDVNGPRCTCGNIGCVEVYCKASGLTDAARRALAGRRDHPFAAAPELSAEMILTAAGTGDKLAGEALSDYCRHLSAAVVSYIHLYDAELVVLGGGLMNAAHQILPLVQQYVDEHTWTCPPRSIPVRPAVLGDRAALIGAAALAHGWAQFR
jgi:glucokinase